MHGQEGEERKRRRHMWPVLGRATAVSTLAPAASSPPVGLPENTHSESSSSSDSFLKDGHKLRVGDCALFQAGNAPPFIGIIRWFKAGKEDCLNLCVNWLYRPADIKLAKGELLEAAPNEVFYSFHKDVISTASLLHPCKVAFLSKGVELPAGTPSFVCRRVYDITNKCLWWLTDQDFINERQEEVDQLLDKTRLEMHTAVQSGGRSPKPLNGPPNTQPLKSGSESVHSTGSSPPSQSKGKRKDKSDLSTEPIKRERSCKSDDGDSTSCKSDDMIKAEILKITDKGGLVSSEGVEKLVNLMQFDKTEKKVDITGRILVADVIAATDRYDCLSKFVQLRGLLILDEWLQEMHRSKTSDGSSPKDSDRTVEELLLALLRALAKLPVNLNALQTCNIGKSVNNLRGHKNPEIQKKARSLIDTWKKRVDAEMTKIIDAKSVASGQPVWQAKPGSSDVSHATTRRSGSSEVGAKNPVTQTAPSKTMPSKPGHSDGSVKSASVTQGSLKVASTSVTSVAGCLKDSLNKATIIVGTTDVQPAAVKEEKSSSSSQSQNNSQTCSGDHVKTVGSSWKEDTRSASAASNPAKPSGGSARNRRSGNGVSVTNISGVSKETHTDKTSSLNIVTTFGKSSQLGLACEKPIDSLVTDHGSNHRLIVKLPNTVRSPARSASGVCFEDPAVSGCRASSPGISDKHELGDHKVKVRDGASQSATAKDTHTDLWQGNDVRPSVGAGVVRSHSADVQHIKSSEETRKVTEAAKVACSSSGHEKEILSTETRMRSSFSSINALIDSCVKCSEDRSSSTPLTVEDDIGMNLLASVAAGEISKSDLISPAGSPGSSPMMEDPSTEAKSRLSSDDGAGQSQKARSSDDDTAQSHVGPGEAVGANFKKQVKIESLTKDVLYQNGPNLPGNTVTMVTLLDNKLSGVPAEHSSDAVSSHKSEDSRIKFEEGKDGNLSGCKPVAVHKLDSSGASPQKEKLMTGGHVIAYYTDCKTNERSSSADEGKPVECARQKIDENACSSEVSSRVGFGLDLAASCCESENQVEEKFPAKEVQEVSTTSAQQQFLILAERSTKTVISSSAPDVQCPQNHNETTGCMLDNTKDFKDKTELEHSEVHNCSPSDLDESVRQPTTYLGTAGVVGDSSSIAAIASTLPDASCLENNDETRTCMADNIEVDNLELKDGKEHKFQLSNLDELVRKPTTLSGTVGVEDSKMMEAHESSSVGLAIRVGPPNCTSQEIEHQPKPRGSRLLQVVDPAREDLLTSAAASSFSVTAEPIAASKLAFDLNEGISGDDGSQGETAVSVPATACSAIDLPSISPFANSLSNSLPAPITIAAPAKRPFVPPEILLKSKGEAGWKGSAATSAFRPAEPRKLLDMPLNHPGITSGKQCRLPLDIDLNEPDDRVLEDMTIHSSYKSTNLELEKARHLDITPRISGGLDLDLNRVNEDMENGQHLASTSKLEVPRLAVGSASSEFPNREANMLRDFDLNNGPGPDEVYTEPRSHSTKNTNSMPFLFPVASVRMNTAEMGSVSSWFPPGSSYPAVAIPSFLSNREQSYPIVAAPGGPRILGPITPSSSFGGGGDVYRSPVLSSSPPMAFTPATFPYAGFSYAPNFPLPAASLSGGSTNYVDSSVAGSGFPAIPSPLVGPAGTVLSNYRRPQLVSLPESSTSGGSDNTRKWITPSLDLNAGPGNGDTEGKDEGLPFASRQFIVATSQPFSEEQMRIYAVQGGGGLKRKEPEGGWDTDRSSYKQLSWQ